jgi:O-antigen/teichoic acid export membrane protein
MIVWYRRVLAFKGVSHSLIDQAILSISNFLIGLVFIRFATKHEYFAYSQLIGFSALSAALQMALINTTALTLLPRKPAAERARTANVFHSLQLTLSLVFATAGGLLLLLAPGLLSMDGGGLMLALSVFLLVVANWYREFVRNIQYINMRPAKCLEQDIAYVTVLVLCIIGLIYGHWVRADAMLLTIGSAGILTAIPWSRGAGLTFNFKLQDWRELWVEVWPLAKWSLPAGIVAWAFGNGYLFVGGQVVGPEQTAEVVAAKLFTAPLGTVFLSWGNIFRPKVSAHLSEGEGTEVRRLSRMSMLGVLVVVAMYLVPLLFAYPYLEKLVLGEKYRGLNEDIALWGVFFLASGISSICHGVLLAGGKYRQSFMAAAVSSVVSLTSLVVLSEMFGKTGLMVGMVAGEATYALMLYIGMRAMLQNVRPHREAGA